MSVQPRRSDGTVTRAERVDQGAADTDTLRVLPIPRTDPPASRPPETAAVPPSGYVQEMLAVDFRRQHDDALFGPQATASRDLPDPGPWARRIVQVVLEVADGVRPAGQLSRWLAPDIHQRVARRGLLARQRGQRQRHVTQVHTVHVCCPADGVAEVAAVVRHQGRCKALALRLSGVDGRWLVTALEIG